MIFKIFKKNNGFSLLEMLIYVSILALMLVVIIEVTNSVVKSQRVMGSQRKIDNSLTLTFERIIREIRLAESVDTAASTLGSHPGVLALDGEDELGNLREVSFYLSGGQVVMEENGALVGAVSQSDVTVTSLIFQIFATSTSQGIRATITLESGTSTHYRSSNFYTSAVTR
jgi:hypothetical protein